MSNRELWDRFCSAYQFYPSVGIALDTSRMNVADNFALSMSERMRKAFKDMAALESGAIANPDEQRMVGHYWLRAPELAPDKELREAIETSARKIKEFVSAVHGGKVKPERAPKFKNILSLGIGGSALGPQLVAGALWDSQAPMQIFFGGDNTDPDGIKQVLLQIGDGLKETLTIVISKSGSTPEPANCMMEVARAYAEAGLSFERHAVAITGKGSKLDKQAEKWLDRFEMWDWVGGRTSIFSAVGLLPAALHGVNVEAFVEGAREMDKITREADAQRNPAALLALMWYAAGEGRGRKDMVVLPYKDRLLLFSRYLQQLIMESLGKEKDLHGTVVHQGLSVYGNKGSTDQHAYVQQLRDGLDNFFVTFVEVLDDYFPGVERPQPLYVKENVTPGDYLLGFFLGTRSALYEKSRSSMTITVDTLSARSLGALIALYDRAVGFYASLININAYHQPGVEAGKKAAEHVLQLQQKIFAAAGRLRAEATVAEICAAIGASGEEETVFKIMEHLAANHERGVKRTGARTPSQVRYSMHA